MASLFQGAGGAIGPGAGGSGVIVGGAGETETVEKPNTGAAQGSKIPITPSPMPIPARSRVHPRSVSDGLRKAMIPQTIDVTEHTKKAMMSPPTSGNGIGPPPGL